MSITHTLRAAAARITDRIPRTITKQLSRPDDTTWLSNMFGGQYNPDTLTYEDYREIMEDPQIRTAKRLIDTYLLSKDYIITPGSDDPTDIEVKEFIEKAFKDDLETDMKHVRQHLYTARDYGYSVSENVLKVDEESKITLSKIVGLQIETLDNCFVLDEYGEITEVVQNITGTADIKLPRDKVNIYTFEGETGNPYGESIYKSLNDTVYFKKKVLLWLAIFLQKHGSPALAAKIGATGNAAAMIESMENIQEGRTALTHGADDEVYVIESSKNGDSFFKAWEKLDVLILRVFLIGSLVLGQSEASGSYSQSQTHMDALKLFLDGMHEDIASVFQRLVKQLVDYNYTVDKYPQFTFEKFDDADLFGLLQALQPYASGMLLDNSNMEGVQTLVRQLYDHYADIVIQEPEEGEEEVNQRPTVNNNITPEEVPLPEAAVPIEEKIGNVFP